MPGTEIAYGPSQDASQDSEGREGELRYLPTRSLCDVRYWHSLACSYGATQCPVLTERMALPEGKQDPRKDAQGEEVEEGEGKKGGFEQEGGLVI
eukprot:3443360-Rhodomonas_salina.2